MLEFTIQKRSNKVDVFLDTTSEAVLLCAKPVEFRVGNKLSTNPEHALMSLPTKDAKELAKKILRACGEDES